MTLTLGIDIGTYESKGVLVDITGRVVAQARHSHQMIVPQPGWAEHRPEADWWADVLAIVRALLAAPDVRADDIAALALSAIGPCMLAVDAQGNALMDAVLYGVDTRARVEVEELTAQIGLDILLDRCGNALTSQSVGPKILWLKRHRPDVFAKAAKIVSSTTYLVQRLTGVCVIDHYTAANFAPFYDVAQQGWASDLAPGVIDMDRLPQLMWSTEIAGQVTANAARETGLPVGIPVTCGTIDAAAEAISVGTRDPGDMMIMYGSTVFIIALAAERTRDARLWYAPWLFPGQHATMAGLATSGTLTHWFRDTFARDLLKETAFDALTAEAASTPPGARGLLCLPYFSGERTPIYDPAARGAFFGLNLTHGRGEMFRAVLEGIASATAHVTETYAAAGAAPKRVLAVGGGTNNAVWLQATSDLTGLPQIVNEVTLGASYGDAFLAAVAIGAAKPDDIARWNPAACTSVPQKHTAYDRQYPLFKALYAQTKDIAHALGTLP